MSTKQIVEIDGQRWEVDGDSDAIAGFVTEMKATQRRNAERDRHFPGEGRQKMTALCRLFPSLADASGIDPWDTDRFVLWALSSGASSGKAHAIRFVLQVWNSRSDWPELLKREVLGPEPEYERDRLLWAGLRRLKQQASEELAADARHDGDQAPVTDEKVLERLFCWFGLFEPFNCCDAFSTWDEAHREAFRTWAAYPFFP